MKKTKLLLSIILCIVLACSPIYAADFGDGRDVSDAPAVASASSVTGGGYRSAIKLKKRKTVTAYICKTERAKLKVSGSKYKWKSSNKKIASVNSKGIVTAKKKGKVTITAKKGKKTYKCKLIVETPKLANKTGSIANGKTYRFKVSGTKQKVKWASSNSSIVSISSKGKATARRAGTVVITAKVSTYKFSQYVTVTAPASSNASNIPNNSGSNNTVSTPVFNLGQTWTVPGQWKLTINYATEMSDRNPYSDKTPVAVYLIDYTYENIGYTSDIMGGLYMSLDMEKVIDSNGYAAYSYPNSPIYYPQVIPIGAKCHAQAVIAVDHKGPLKIYLDEYAGNSYTEKYSAIFNVPIS